MSQNAQDHGGREKNANLQANDAEPSRASSCSHIDSGNTVHIESWEAIDGQLFINGQAHRTTKEETLFILANPSSNKEVYALRDAMRGNHALITQAVR